MFTVESVDDTVARLRAGGAELVGEVARYEDLYRRCYLRGPASIIVALAEELCRGTLPRNSAEAVTASGDTGDTQSAPSTRAHGSQPSCVLACLRRGFVRRTNWIRCG